MMLLLPLYKQLPKRILAIDYINQNYALPLVKTDAQMQYRRS